MSEASAAAAALDAEKEALAFELDAGSTPGGLFDAEELEAELDTQVSCLPRVSLWAGACVGPASEAFAENVCTCCGLTGDP